MSTTENRIIYDILMIHPLIFADKEVYENRKKMLNM